MRFIVAISCLLVFHSTRAQTVGHYFEKIRNNTAALTAFMAQMPKGGDLHHHYSGSVYAETFLDYVIQTNLYINRNTLEIAPRAGIPNDAWTTFSVLKEEGTLPKYRQQLLQQWSVKDFNHVDYPADKQFFEAFAKFRSAVSPTLDRGLLEIKTRAKKENVSYIETLLEVTPNDLATTDLSQHNSRLRQHQLVRDEPGTTKLLDSLYQVIIAREAKKYALNFNENIIAKRHNGLKLDDDRFTMRYQNFVLRFMEPVDLFKNLIIACESDQASELVVGVNIVAPENEPVAMSDYWLHMVMFKYCHSKYPQLKYALHAGELALGMVKPEDLNWHINAAVHLGGASRIGHGVAIPYEQNAYDLLRHMSNAKIAVEINLSSNEFILNVKDDRHPIMLYDAFGVPIVIGSDDAGILRTSLTEQYVLLAKRYKDLSYTNIKQYVYNSIRYSFIAEPTVKQKIINDLNERFRVFEASVPASK